MMRLRARKVLGLIFLLLFVSYYSSITLFWHSHKLGYTIIFHSHPFSNQQHNHTAAQYDLIKILTVTAGFIAFSGLFVIGSLVGKRYLLVAKPISNALQYNPDAYYRRGPPVGLN